jgi:hypothetical protein
MAHDTASLHGRGSRPNWSDYGKPVSSCRGLERMATRCPRADALAAAIERTYYEHSTLSNSRPGREGRPNQVGCRLTGATVTHQATPPGGRLPDTVLQWRAHLRRERPRHLLRQRHHGRAGSAPDAMLWRLRRWPRGSRLAGHRADPQRPRQTSPCAAAGAGSAGVANTVGCPLPCVLCRSAVSGTRRCLRPSYRLMTRLTALNEATDPHSGVNLPDFRLCAARSGNVGAWQASRSCPV